MTEADIEQRRRRIDGQALLAHSVASVDSTIGVHRWRVVTISSAGDGSRG